MIRNGRTPTILLVALVMIILVLCYNNWGLSQRNISLKESLMAKEEKLNDMMEKKAFVEKQIGINSDRIKYFEERIEANKQMAQQKDSDIDDLNSKLKAKYTENDKLTLELNDAKEALNLCKLEKNKEIEIIKNNEQARYQEDLNKIMLQKSNSNCSSMLEEYKESIRKMVKSQFSEKESSKFLALLDTKNNNLMLDGSQNVEKNIVNQQVAYPILNKDTCKLPKMEGNCTNPKDKYYYDTVSERCLIFAYSGCNGNANNFDTLEQCQKVCTLLTIKGAEQLTSMANKNDFLPKPKN